MMEANEIERNKGILACIRAHREGQDDYHYDDMAMDLDWLVLKLAGAYKEFDKLKGDKHGNDE